MWRDQPADALRGKYTITAPIYSAGLPQQVRLTVATTSSSMSEILALLGAAAGSVCRGICTQEQYAAPSGTLLDS